MTKIKELTSRNIPNEIIRIWQNAGYTELLPIQEDAVNSGVLDGKSILIVAPTSSGKTFIGEMTAVFHALRGRKTLYLVPFKALAEEKYADFSQKYGGEGIGFSVRISDRDHRNEDRNIAIGNYDIAILTYEKLSALLVLNPGILDACQCIIVDEVQMIMDKERGANLELLLTKLKYVKKLQIIALSAVLDELNEFDEWLGLDLIHRKDRPVELRQGAISLDGVFHYREWNSGELGDENFGDGHFDKLLQTLLSKGEQIVVIRNSVRSVWQTALNLESNFAHLPAASKTIKQLNQETETETQKDLLICLRHSIAFHHADCELSERRIIEDGFRRGEIKILVATTTLSMGVNLPCKTVILADNFKWDFLRGGLQQVNWLVGEVQNIFGRAGRLGKGEEFGRGMFLAENLAERMQLMGAYIDAPLEILISVVQKSDIDHWVIDAVSTGFAKNKQEIIGFIIDSFAAKKWSEWEKEQTISHIENAIRQNIENDLLELSENLIKPTNLGKVCAAKGVSIKTFDDLKLYMENISALDVLDVAFAAALASEVRSVYYRGIKWADRIRRQKVVYRYNQLQGDGELIGFVGREFEKVWQSFDENSAPQFTIAVLAKDVLKSHRPTQEILEAYNLTTANLKNICLNLSWIMDTLSGIADVEYPQIAVDLSKMAECVKNSAPLDSYLLNGIDVDLSRDDRIRLIEAGLKSEDDFIGLQATDLRGIVNHRKADLIIKQILRKRDKDQQFWIQEHKRRLEILHVETDLIDSLYNSWGADLENSICELFETGFADCNIVKITDRKAGEPNLLMIFPDGNELTILIIAKKGGEFVSSSEAGEIISQSARFHPKGYICFGRPDFQSLAKEQAKHLGMEYNFKLIPIFALAELYVRFMEGKLSKNQISDLLFDARGYFQ